MARWFMMARNNFVASYRYDLPFAKLFRQSNRVTRGWSISGITRFSSGLPVTLVNPNDTALVGSFNNGVNGNGFSDLDIASGSLQLNHNQETARRISIHRSSVFQRSARPVRRHVGSSMGPEWTIGILHC